MVRKWTRNSEWQKQPHIKDGPPPSLWWYRRPDRHRVIDDYIYQCSRGRKLPGDFKDDLVQWLSDLSAPQNLKAWGRPRTVRFWDIPSYARANQIEKATLMKRVREMEKIAKKMFPSDVPSGRKARAPLSDEEIAEMRQLCLDGSRIKELAHKFRVTASRVGLICRTEKAIVKQREQASTESGSAAGTPVDFDPETPF